MMHKDVLLELEIEGERSDIAAVLGDLELIESYVIEEGEGSGTVKTSIHTSAEVDIRRELFYALAKAKLPIMSLCRKEDSLEDVFLELTGEVMQSDEEIESTGEAPDILKQDQPQGGEEHDCHL